MSKLKEKAKEIARKLKAKRASEEAVGKPKIDNVKDPKKLKAAKLKEDKDKEAKRGKKTGRARVVGPKGGVYEQTSTGGKKYGSEVKKSLEDFLDEEIQDTIELVKSLRE